MSLIISGKQIVVPGVVPEVNASAMTPTSLGAARIGLVIGISEGGDPAKIYTFRTLDEAKSVIRSGTALSYLARLFRPSPSLPGASMVEFIRAQVASRASLAVGVGPLELIVTPALSHISWVEHVAESGGAVTTDPATQTLHVQILRHGIVGKLDFYFPFFLAGGWDGFSCTVDGIDVTQAMGQDYPGDGLLREGTGLLYTDAPDEFDIVFSGPRNGWAAGYFDSGLGGSAFYVESEDNPDVNAEGPVGWTHDPFFFATFNGVTNGASWPASSTSLDWAGGVQTPTTFMLDVFIFRAGGHDADISVEWPLFDGGWGSSCVVESGALSITKEMAGDVPYVASPIKSDPTQWSPSLDMRFQSADLADCAMGPSWFEAPGVLVTLTDGKDTVKSNPLVITQGVFSPT